MQLFEGPRVDPSILFQVIFHPCASFLSINLPNPISFFSMKFSNKNWSLSKKNPWSFALFGGSFGKKVRHFFSNPNPKKIRTAVRPVGGRNAKPRQAFRESKHQHIAAPPGASWASKKNQEVILRPYEGLILWGGWGMAFQGGGVRGTLRFDLEIKTGWIPAEFLGYCMYIFKNRKRTQV